MFKKTIFLLFLMIFVLTGCSKPEPKIDVYQNIIKRDKIVVGVQYDAKPFGYMDSDRTLKGVDVDIAKELSKRILGDENKIVFKQVTPANRIQSITSGNVDMVIATMSITPQRKTIIDFSDPYYIAGQAILVPEDSTINSSKDLNDKEVIVILGTTGEKNLRYFAPHAILKGYKTYSEGFSALKQKKADALTTDDSILMGFIIDNKGYKILAKRLTKEPYGIAFKNSEDASSLKVNINRILSDMRTDGFMYNLKTKWKI